MKENSSAFSIGKAKRESSQQQTKKLIPGPGQYEPSSNVTFDGPKKSPGWRIGSEKRDIFGNEIKSSVAPGPGVYDVEKGQKFVKGKFSPKITMGYRYDDKSHINPVHKPGPGAYEPSFVAHQTSKSFTMGLKLNSKTLTTVNSPGPGAYSVEQANHFVTHGGTGATNNANYSFPKETRNITKDIEKKANDFPDPTSYSPQVKSGQPVITMGQKISTESSQKFMTPGPGQYTITSSFQRLQSNTIDYKKSSHRDGSERVGGQSVNVGRGGTRQTITSQVSNDIPGPGSYSLNNHTKIYRRTPGVSMGTSNRPDITKKSEAQLPGPNQYLPNISVIKKATANWRINQSYREREQSLSRNVGNFPGPGTYDVRVEVSSQLKSSPKVPMGLKLGKESKLLKSTPGPLEYDPKLSQVKIKGPSYRIGTQPQRISLAEKALLESPSPQAYFQESRSGLNQVKSAGPKWSFGSSQREQIGGVGESLRKSLNQPGPGTYYLPSSVGNVPHYDKARAKLMQIT